MTRTRQDVRTAVRRDGCAGIPDAPGVPGREGGPRVAAIVALAALLLAVVACGPMSDEDLLAAWPAVPVAERTRPASAILSRGLFDGATEAEVVAALGEPARGDRVDLGDGTTELVYTVDYVVGHSYTIVRQVLRFECRDGVVVRGEFAERPAR